ncbi:hypothetical protein [uncultured Vagococcus sp.]|uniref:hypothetical protein n=1 Tax=uncultured Vagococcus sp. TaxID=189676 RepID=UPI0028D23E0D|nr:hypothetical protein [uncultured Vagococcus sp.]
MIDVIEKAREDEKAICGYAWEEGYKEGYELGLRESIKNLGLCQQIALKSIEIGLSVELISEATGLAPQQIRALTFPTQ